MTTRMFRREKAEQARASLDEVIDALPKPERKRLSEKIERLAKFLDAAIEVAPSAGESLKKTVDKKIASE